MSLQLAGHVAWRELAGETFVIDLEARRMFGLNGAGGRVWRAISESRDPSSVVDASVAGSVGGFVSELLDLGLVVDGDSASPLSLPGEVFDGGDAVADPPQVVWQEELHVFAASCAENPAVTPVCGSVPQV